MGSDSDNRVMDGSDPNDICLCCVAHYYLFVAVVGNRQSIAVSYNIIIL